MRTRVFTTGVLLRRGLLLIMKRKPDDDTYPAVWDCPGGHFKEDETAEDCMLREAKEETGLAVRIVRSGSPIEFIDRYGRAIALPFLIRGGGDVTLTEHTEYRWVKTSELRAYEVVPDLTMALRAFGLVAVSERAGGRPARAKSATAER